MFLQYVNCFFCFSMIYHFLMFGPYLCGTLKCRMIQLKLRQGGPRKVLLYFINREVLAPVTPQVRTPTTNNRSVVYT